MVIFSDQTKIKEEPIEPVDYEGSSSNLTNESIAAPQFFAALDNPDSTLKEEQTTVEPHGIFGEQVKIILHFFI